MDFLFMGLLLYRLVGCVCLVVLCLMGLLLGMI